MEHSQKVGRPHKGTSNIRVIHVFEKSTKNKNKTLQSEIYTNNSTVQGPPSEVRLVIRIRSELEYARLGS
jgi:hypothetical protein